MKELFVSYDIALLARKKGFNENCFGLWISNNYGGTPEKPIIISVGGHWGSNISSSMISTKDFNLKPEECPAPLYQQIVYVLLRAVYNPLIVLQLILHRLLALQLLQLLLLFLTQTLPFMIYHRMMW